MAGYKVLGVNSDHDTCSRCGKTNLKKVVWLALEDGEPEPVGADCAGRLLRKTGNRVWKEAAEKDAQRAKDEANRIHEVGEVRSVRPFVVESIGCNGGSITTLCLANGSKLLIEEWAAAKYPNTVVNVRVAI